MLNLLLQWNSNYPDSLGRILMRQPNDISVLCDETKTWHQAYLDYLQSVNIQKWNKRNFLTINTN